MTDKHAEAGKGDILIVDDAPANLRLLSTMLGRQGYRARSSISGAMALMAVKTEPPDLILLDINMPDMNGYQVCENLKDDETTRDIPVIFISALDESIDKAHAFTVGGVDYISKPFQLKEVIVRIETHLTLQRLKQELQHTRAELQAVRAELQAVRNIQES